MDKIIKELEAARRTIESIAPQEVENLADKIIATLKRGNTIILVGNGGSAAQCQHIAAEFTIRFKRERVALPAISLTTDTSAITACGNDYSFERIFSRQLEAIGRRGDLLLALSTSGNSPNIITTCEVAQEKRITSYGLLGKDGGALRQICDYSLVVRNDSTARIQEAHITILHIVCGLVDEIFGQ